MLVVCLFVVTTKRVSIDRRQKNIIHWKKVERENSAENKGFCIWPIDYKMSSFLYREP
jgi:hypothetical protein